MAAFKVTAPLQETTRHNVRTVRTEGSQVFTMEKEPLSIGQIRVSPPPNQTFLVVEPGEPELVALRATVNRLELRVQNLEDERESRNESLYRPVFASRELAIVSLLMHQRDLLDELVEKEIRVKARAIEKDGTLGSRRDRKEAKKDFLKQFGTNQKLTYFQLARACENGNNQVLLEVLTSAERAFLDDYENQGCRCSGAAVNVRLSMRALRFAKKCRDQSAAHIFDFDFTETGRASIEQQRASQKLQASVLLDLQNAIEKDWLEGNFKTLGNPHSGTLVLEIARKIKELQDVTGFSIKDLAEMS